MKTFILIVGMFSLECALACADTIQLADGSKVEGQLGAPVEIAVKTSAGEKRIPFVLLPPDVQGQYWRKAAEDAASSAAVEIGLNAPVTDEDLAALANEVNLESWAQAAAVGSFQDRPEKRDAAGLVTSKACNAIEENWVSVYSPKDAVGKAGNWDEQAARARRMQERAAPYAQKRWLDEFIKAGEAVARRDSNQFALLVQDLHRSPMNLAGLGRTGEKIP
jgi:hypothetical protein